MTAVMRVSPPGTWLTCGSWRSGSVVGEPAGDQVGRVRARVFGRLQVVRAANELERLVGRRNGIVDLARVTRKDANIRKALDDQRSTWREFSRAINRIAGVEPA